MEPREFPTNLFCCSCSYCYYCSGSFTKGLQKEQEHEKEQNERKRSVIPASSHNPDRGDSAADGVNELRQESSERRNTNRSKERGRFFRQTRETGGRQVSRGGETILHCRRQPKYADAYALLSGHAKARMSLNQFAPAQQDADFQQNELNPFGDVTTEQ